MFPYGDDYARSHVAFYMAVTVVSCIFCLMHLRSAAFIVAAIVNGAFILFFLSQPEPTFIAIAINVLLVCVGMMSILLTNSRDFEQMVVSQQRTEALNNENQRLANIDSLTGLRNRRAFFSHLAAELKKSQITGQRLALGVIDLDGFKPVNDLYGHSTGDRLLAEVGKRLSDVPDNCSAFRLGGDEFAVVLTNADEDGSPIFKAKSLAERFRVPFHMPEATVQISASMGVAVYPDTASTVEQLFDRADYALYHLKKTSRGETILFDADHEAQINSGARIEHALKQADLTEELSIVFQPIIDDSSQRPIGFEALARWYSPSLGYVSPAQFFPVAERAGIVGLLTTPLLRKALACASRWPGDLRLSFNLSAHDLNSQQSVLALVGIIESSSFDARRLDLEITETAFGYDFEQVTQSVEMLHRLGCGISLDDFGTGYSSLTRLHALPLTKIKIDRSFVTDLHKRPASYKIVKSLLTLSHDMGLECVVEGVESSEELAALRTLGGTIVQGYFYSPPLSDSDVSEFLSRYSGLQLAGPFVKKPR